MTMTVPQWTLVDRLRKAREHAGITQDEMAEHLGVSRQTVGNYEAGRTRPRRGVLRAWADVTEVPLIWLETGETERRQAVAPVDLERRREGHNRTTTRPRPRIPWSSAHGDRRPIWARTG